MRNCSWLPGFRLKVRRRISTASWKRAGFIRKNRNPRHGARHSRPVARRSSQPARCSGSKKFCFCKPARCSWHKIQRSSRPARRSGRPARCSSRRARRLRQRKFCFRQPARRSSKPARGSTQQKFRSTQEKRRSRQKNRRSTQEECRSPSRKSRFTQPVGRFTYLDHRATCLAIRRNLECGATESQAVFQRTDEFRINYVGRDSKKRGTQENTALRDIAPGLPEFLVSLNSTAMGQRAGSRTPTGPWPIRWARELWVIVRRPFVRRPYWQRSIGIPVMNYLRDLADTPATRPPS